MLTGRMYVLKSDNVKYLADFTRENETKGILDLKNTPQNIDGKQN